jgi:hypothetical protein
VASAETQLSLEDIKNVAAPHTRSSPRKRGPRPSATSCATAIAASVALTLLQTQRAGAETPVECGYCPAIVSQARTDAERRAEPAMCYALVGALGELEAYRSAFDKRPLYINLFPVIYWTITDIEFRRISEGAFAHPFEKLTELVDFFDAFEVNRLRWDTTGAAEPHWQAHYLLARDADRDFGAIGQGAASDTPSAVDAVLSSAIAAHIKFDLPRAIRASFAQRLDPSLTEADLHDDYLKTDATFAAAAGPSAAELFAAVTAKSTWNKRLLDTVGADWMADLIASKTDAVLAMRRQAWAAAVGDAPLPTGDAPQPSGDHARLEAEGRAACAVS